MSHQDSLLVLFHYFSWCFSCVVELFQSGYQNIYYDICFDIVPKSLFGYHDNTTCWHQQPLVLHNGLLQRNILTNYITMTFLKYHSGYLGSLSTYSWVLFIYLLSIKMQHRYHQYHETYIMFFGMLPVLVLRQMGILLTLGQYRKQSSLINHQFILFD